MHQRLCASWICHAIRTKHRWRYNWISWRFLVLLKPQQFDQHFLLYTWKGTLIEFFSLIVRSWCYILKLRKSPRYHLVLFYSCLLDKEPQEGSLTTKILNTWHLKIIHDFYIWIPLSSIGISISNVWLGQNRHYPNSSSNQSQEFL